MNYNCSACDGPYAIPREVPGYSRYDLYGGVVREPLCVRCLRWGWAQVKLAAAVGFEPTSSGLKGPHP